MPLFKTFSQCDSFISGLQPVSQLKLLPWRLYCILREEEEEKKTNFCHWTISENSLPSCDVKSSGYLCAAEQTTKILHTPEGGIHFVISQHKYKRLLKGLKSGSIIYWAREMISKLVVVYHSVKKRCMRY